MTPVVIAVIFGTLLGELLHLEEHITHVFGAVTRKPPHDEANFDMERLYITVVVLFCASGFGIYGVLVEGMSGGPAVLQSKAVLDLCTAAVFAVTLRRGGGSDRVAHAGGHAGAVLCGRGHCTVSSPKCCRIYQLRRCTDHCGRYAGQRHQAVPHG